MSKKTIHGSCHCGKVKFEAQVDLSKGTTRCNCSYCQKSRYWAAHVSPADFKLVAGEDSLQSYSKTRRDVPFQMDRKMEVYENDLCFCKTCGLHAFNIGNIPEVGGDYVSISVGCFDDVDYREIMKQPVIFMNGREDNWFEVPEFTAHL